MEGVKSRILAIIPARSGSKGLKDKNIKILNGKPLIAYTIEATMKSEIFNDIVVSTDSQKYADIAVNCGASVPFIRSKNLSMDNSSTNDVIEETLNKLKRLGKEYDNFMLLQPTSPLRDESDIIGAFDLFTQKDANSVVSMCECEHSPVLSRQLEDGNCLDGFLSNLNKSRRQDLGTYYRLNGAIYISKVDYFFKYRDLYKENSYAYIMDKEKSIDIDDIFDFKLAEFLMTFNKGDE